MSCYDTVEPLNNGHVEDENFVHCSEVVLSSEVATVKMNECLCVCVCVCVCRVGGGGGGVATHSYLKSILWEYYLLHQSLGIL